MGRISSSPRYNNHIREGHTWIESALFGGVGGGVVNLEKLLEVLEHLF